MDYYLVINSEIIGYLTIPLQYLAKVAEIVLCRLIKTIRLFWNKL